MNSQQQSVYQGNHAEQELMRNLSMQHKTHFRIVCTDMGETVYEWMGVQLKNLSSMRLASYLRWAEYEGLLSTQFAEMIKKELVERGHYEASLAWKL